MKKLFVIALAGLAMGLVACGGPAEEGGQPSGGSYDTTVNTDSTYVCYKVAGNIESAPGAGDIDWDFSADYDGGENVAVMKACSLNDVAQKSTALADLYKARGVSFIYMSGTISFGTSSSDWPTNYIQNGEVKEGHGNQVFKVCGMETTTVHDDESGADLTVYNRAIHIPSPECYAENLTPDMYYSGPKGEEPDAAGNDHNYNPVVFEAGSYTIFCAKYKKVTDGYVYGIGLVKNA